jgi:3-hydroxyacyl-[acyl-carrier-protein] dehydratase
MLLNDFFSIVNEEHTNSTIRALLKINGDHPIFEGHFPGQPVVPGVCMLQMVREVMEVQLDKKLFITEADNIKFLTVINPDQHSQIQLSISYKRDENVFSLQASLFEGNTTFFKLKAIFKIEE